MPENQTSEVTPDAVGQPTEPAPEPTPAPDLPAISPPPALPAPPVKPRKPRFFIAKLRLPKAKWNTERLAAVDEFGKMMTPKRVADLNMVESVERLEDLNASITHLRGIIARSQNASLDVNLIMAHKVMAEIVLAHQKVSEHMLKMAERSHQNEPELKKRNLPPVFSGNVFAGPVTVSPPANDVGTPQAAIDVPSE